MKQFTGKTVDEAITAACAELNVAAEDLIYTVIEEKKGLFTKKAVIAIADIDDAAKEAARYLESYLEGLKLNGTVDTEIEDGVIRVTIDCNKNSLLIGKGGSTLQALNDLTRLAVHARLGMHFRLLVDVAGYKEDKYERLIRLAQRTAKEVLATKLDAKLEPMPADERRVIHQALTGWDHIKTESEGEGINRAIVISYED